MPADITEAAEALRFVDATDRDVWIRMGMALRHGFGDRGFDAWNEWSARAPNYNAKAARTAWRSFRPGRVTIASLFWLARQNGYEGAQDARERPPRQDWKTAERTAREQALLAAREQQRKERAVGEVMGIIDKCEIKPHPYLERKGFPAENVLVSARGWLVIPVFNARGQIRSAQYISDAGVKKFHPGGEIGGNYHRIGRAQEVWLTEGYATGLSIRAALRERSLSPEVRCCFSAGNMRRVGQAAVASGAAVYCIADHDKSGVGEKAAQAIGCPYWMPPKEKHDANDHMQAHGLDALATALRDFRHGTRVEA